LPPEPFWWQCRRFATTMLAAAMNSQPLCPLVGRHYETGQAMQWEIAAGRIAAVREVSLSTADAQRLPWVAPGFLDIQSNGYGGQEFS
jgi:hypothetical protein